MFRPAMISVSPCTVVVRPEAEQLPGSTINSLISLHGACAWAALQAGGAVALAARLGFAFYEFAWLQCALMHVATPSSVV